MQTRVLASVCIALSGLFLSSCEEEAVEVPVDVVAKDPLLAKALNDPLMVDPDLSWRNEANAAVAIRDGHPLPPFDASDAAISRARDAVRLELLDNGQIPAMPLPSNGEGKPSLANLTTADAMIEAVGSRTDCIDAMTDELSWSTGLPPWSSIMPHGMVQQAAGVDQGNCVVRVVRYLTPISIDDALEYHFAKADRARFRVERYSSPEAQIFAERRDQAMAFHVRKGPGGLTAVDIVHWRK